MVSITTLIGAVAALGTVGNAAPNRHGLHAHHGHKLMNRQAYGYDNSTMPSVYVPGPTGSGSLSEPPVYVSSTIKSYTTTCVTLTYTLGGGRPVTTTVTKTIPVPVTTTGAAGPHVPTYDAPGPVETAPTDEETSPVTPSDEDTSPVVPKAKKVVTVTQTVTESATVTVECGCSASATEKDETTTVYFTSTIFIAPTFVPEHTAAPEPTSSADPEDKTTKVTKTYTRPTYGHGPYYNGTHSGHPNKPSYGPGPVGPTGTAILPSGSAHPVPTQSSKPEPSFTLTVYVMPVYENPSAAPSATSSPEQPPTYGRN